MVLRPGFVAVALAVAALGITTGASADGMARNKIGDACCAHSWTGFYLGAGAGYSTFVNNNALSDVSGGPLTIQNQDTGGKGALGTVIAGYDHQFGKVVAGVFVDYDWSNVEGDWRDRAGNNFSGNFKQTSAWAAGARLGMLANPNTLLFVSAGWTQAKFDGVDFTVFQGATPTRFIADQTFNGYFIGGGIETQLSSNLGLRLEYRYSDFGNESVDRVTNTGAFNAQVHQDLTTQSIRAVLSYKFAGRSDHRDACCAHSWTGFYLGAGGGYGTFVNNNASADVSGGPLTIPNQDTGGKGVFGTVTAGYDQQFGKVVAGIFVDYDWSSAEGEWRDRAGGNNISGTFKQESAWAIGARLGMLANPGTLLYLSGGWTQAKFDGVDFTVFGAASPSRFLPSQTFDGWFLGAGIESQLSSNLGLRLEYRYSDFGHEIVDRVTNVFSAQVHEDLTTQSVRAVLTYKFNSGRDRELK